MILEGFQNKLVLILLVGIFLTLGSILYLSASQARNQQISNIRNPFDQSTELPLR